MRYFIVQNNNSDMPKTPKEAIQRMKDTNEILNEFREPTKPVSSGDNIIFSSPITTYLFYSLVFLAIAFVYLYWRYKKSL